MNTGPLLKYVKIRKSICTQKAFAFEEVRLWNASLLCDLLSFGLSVSTLKTLARLHISNVSQGTRSLKHHMHQFPDID